MMITLQQAKRIVHSQRLNIRDQLFVLLAVDPGGPSSINQIRQLCADAGLPGLARKNISDALGKSPGYVARTAEGWELQESGVSRVRQLSPIECEREASVAVRNVVRSRAGLATSVEDILALLSAFPDCVGYALNRRMSPILPLNTEASVQDLIYFMLRPGIIDLVPEQPIANATRQYSLEDYMCRNLSTVVEAKFVRSKQHGRTLKKELHDDIGEYKADASCQHLIFFVYDPNKYLESPTGLTKAIEGAHVHNGKGLNVYCVVQT
jgi:DpnII restriction endonuclease